MDVFTMVVLIVVITVGARFAERYFRHRGDSGRHWGERDARIAQLEERVKALEAVVSDHGYSLKQEFRTLERG
ncbi:MAG TPA: hypothetical protein VGE51_06375 [Fontimonas sp.]